jgi:hypothetical protein
MGKANARGSSVVAPLAGSAVDPFPCPFGGSSPATRKDRAQPKPCFPLTKPNPPKRSSAMKRWSLEATCEEGRAHLGLETHRQWSDRAIERTTPRLLGLDRLVTLLGYALVPDGQLPLQRTTWYRKQAATFSDILALVRWHLWGHFVFPTSPTHPDVVLLPRSTLAQLAHAVCYCAKLYKVALSTTVPLRG